MTVYIVCLITQEIQILESLRHASRFLQSEEKSLEDGKDETCDTKQASELSESNPKDTEKPKSAEEQTPAPVVDTPAKIEAEKTQEIASTVAEVPKLETSREEKIEDIKTTTEGKDETPEMRTEEKAAEVTQKSETHVEEKTEEKPTDTQHPEKKTEEAPATPQIEDKKPPGMLEETMEN